ncbi:hypothetical protein AB0K60_11640 [Thermopolyspora sp. NPDC052614]|uniref:hypothetical protein n=1 Tax=Thermopolyspora sp. NPDC052614 TaxID=3155682 RepID=UPI003447FD17
MSQSNDPRPQGQGPQGYGRPESSFGPPQDATRPLDPQRHGSPGQSQPGPPGQPYGPPGTPPYAPQSAYGAPPPPGGYGPPGGKPEIRPRRIWILLSWLAFVASIIVLVYGTYSAVGTVAEDVAPPSSFRSGEVKTLTLNPQDRPVLYVSATSQVNVRCEAASATGAEVALTKPGYTASITAGGRIWEHIFDIGITQAGSYQVRCTAPEGADVAFGVGKPITSERAVNAAGSILLYIGLIFVTFIVAVVVTVIVLVRRSRAKRRLAGPWQPYGPAGR